MILGSRSTFQQSANSARAARDTALGRLGRISREQRARIAARIGCPHSDAASLMDHLSRPSVALLLLCDLSAYARCAVRLFIEASDLLPRKMAEEELRHRIGSRSVEALADLDRLGLLLYSTWSGGAELVGILPPLVHSMRPFVWLLDDTLDEHALISTHLAERDSMQVHQWRTLSLVIAAIACDRPRMGRGGGIHVSDASRLVRDRLQATLSSVSSLQRLVGCLFSLGLLDMDGEERGLVRWNVAESFFGLPKATRLRLLVSIDGISEPLGRRACGDEAIRDFACRALAELPIGQWARRSSVEAAVLVRCLAADNQSPYADLYRKHSQVKARVHRSLNDLLPCLDRHESELGTWVRLPKDVRSDEGFWFVQPDHDVLVTPEVSSADVARLARVADLLRSDVMVEMRVDPHSVGRALDSGLDSEEIIDLLSMRAAHGLPEGLDVQIRDWATGTWPKEPARRDESLATGSSSDTRPRQRRETRRTLSSTLPHRRPPPPALPEPQREQWDKLVSRFRRRAKG